jgi:hypothetical protein
MKTSSAVTISLVASLFASIASGAEATAPRHPPPPVNQAPPRPAALQSAGVYVYDQKPISSRASLVSQEQAREIVERFRTAYDALGKPRMLVFVNRELVDEQAGMVLTGRTERYETTRKERTVDFTPAPGAAPSASAPTTVAATGSVTIGTGAVDDLPGGKGGGTSETTRTSGENTYQVRQAVTPSLTDRQTTRDVERLFGRPLRLAGASLADQRVGAQLIGDKPLNSLTQPASAQAQRDREALQKHADVVLEVLVGTRAVTTTGFNGTEVTTIPDIQATAIRLSDARVLGQASSTDVLGQDRSAGAVARRYETREIVEATALALMQDMMLQSGR